MNRYVEDVIAYVKKNYSYQPEFVQTVEEVFTSIAPVVDAHPEYERADLLKRMVEPERKMQWIEKKRSGMKNVLYHRR